MPPETEPIILTLLARSPRVSPESLAALPAWRDAVHPGQSLVDVLVAAEVLHTPARQMLGLVQAGALQATDIPVFLTALGSNRLEALLREPLPASEPAASQPASTDQQRWAAVESGDFIPLGAAVVADDDSPEIDWDQFGSGDFIRFAAEAGELDADGAEDHGDDDESQSWDAFESGEFIDFSTR